MKTLQLLIFSLVALGCSNCQKTTTARGKVSNYISGKPITGIPVTLTGYDGNNPHDSNIPDPCDIKEIKTDMNGEYELEVGCSGMDKVSISVGNSASTSPFQNGFFHIERNGSLRLGKSNVIDFQVDSLDGKIKFIFQNMKPVEDSIYVLVHCNALGDLDYYYCGGHNVYAVSAGGSSSDLAYVTANRFVKYYWDTVPFTKTNAAHVDSIYCARNDSVSCVIVF